MNETLKTRIKTIKLYVQQAHELLEKTAFLNEGNHANFLLSKPMSIAECELYGRRPNRSLRNSRALLVCLSALYQSIQN